MKNEILGLTMVPGPGIHAQGLGAQMTDFFVGKKLPRFLSHGSTEGRGSGVQQSRAVSRGESRCSGRRSLNKWPIFGFCQQSPTEIRDRENPSDKPKSHGRMDA